MWQLLLKYCQLIESGEHNTERGINLRQRLEDRLGKEHPDIKRCDTRIQHLRRIRSRYITGEIFRFWILTPDNKVTVEEAVFANRKEFEEALIAWNALSENRFGEIDREKIPRYLPKRRRKPGRNLKRRHREN